MKKPFWLITFSFIAGLHACNNKQDNTTVKENTQQTQEQQTEVNYCDIFSQKSTYHTGDTISLAIHYEKTPDTVTVYIDGNQTDKFPGGKDKYKFATANFRTGHHQLMLISQYGKQKETDSYNFLLLSDIKPEIKKVEVIKIFPHDKKAYTQGLLFDNGYLYEGTGQWGQSSLRKIKLPDYEIIQSYSLPDNVFGEGIVLYKDEIIQLTWQSRTAFVFDKENFTLKNKFSYTTEGWGITNLGDRLIMSDGSNTLYELDPNTFTVIDKIEVYDDKRGISALNELENINGLIYANVYQTDTIVVIDPANGKILKKIDCTGLLTDEDKFPGIDVLNGIAYDHKTGKIYITGKNWPKLFEVKM